MVAHGEEGHVVNTASLAGWMPGGGPYGVTKHGVLSLSETLYSDLKARDSRISASVLCPGFVNTQIFNAERNRPQTLAVSDTGPDLMAGAQAMLAQGKQPAEIANRVFDSIAQDRFYILPHPAWDDIVKNREGQYRVRLMKNHKSADCAYPPVEVLPDDTIVFLFHHLPCNTKRIVRKHSL